MINDYWQEKSFSDYDVVVHVAGIVHTKETKKNTGIYYKVNRDLAIEVAKKSKAEGIKHFIFISTMSVYGLNIGIITKDTIPQPRNSYGKSKLQAEEGIKKLSSEDFNIAIIRPPMVYGKYCKGNFQALLNIVEKSPLFPRCNNKRSMIYIDHICAFIKLLIDIEGVGVFFPQNKQYFQTSQTAILIAKSKNKKLRMSTVAGAVVSVLRFIIPMFKKGFGDLIYQDTEEFDYCYCTVDFTETIMKSV